MKINALLVKIKAFILLIKKKGKQPEYTFKTWCFKCGQLFIYVMGMELSGLRVYELDAKLIKGMITMQEARGFNYVYFAGLNGLFMGLALWRMFELFWWARHQAKLSTM